MLELYNQIERAAEVIRAAWSESPHAGIILGTGLGHLVEQIEVAAALDYEARQSYSVRVRSTDRGGLQLEKAFTITTTNVLEWDFTGFYQPVDSIPTLNSVNAGRAIPIKFSLGGNRGLDIFDSGYPKSQAITCDSGAVVDGIEETVTAGSSELKYDAATDRYQYVWKTDQGWFMVTRTRRSSPSTTSIDSTGSRAGAVRAEALWASSSFSTAAAFSGSPLWKLMSGRRTMSQVMKSSLGSLVSLTQVFRGVIWFIIVDIITLAILIAVPEISLLLPSFM